MATTEEAIEEKNAWWTTLRHEGVLLSPPVLEEVFPEGPPEISEWKLDTLRGVYDKFRTDPEAGLYDWLDQVLQHLTGHENTYWVKEQNIPSQFKNERRRPHRVLMAEPGEESEARLLVYIDNDRVTKDNGDPARLGLYRGKREYAEFVRLLRETETSLGLLTNGHQFRLIQTGLDQPRWVEWDAEAWFEGGEGRGALRGFYGLLGPEMLPVGKGAREAPLYERIQESRDRQADLSYVMGDQVREAVELLLQELDDSLAQLTPEEREAIRKPFDRLEQDFSRDDELRALYQAAIRVIMRMVVTFYAESRELFPQSNEVYFRSYSLDNLFHQLREARLEEGEDELRARHGAWARIQALNRLVYHGGNHKDLNLPGYGGQLFQPPSQDNTTDEVTAALGILEHDYVKIPDSTVLDVLEKLKVGRYKVGKAQWKTGPVDFSDLRTEYIGMMYEGLLDYDLREAREEDGGIVILDIGDEPALPLRVLQHAAEDDARLKRLIKDLKKGSSSSTVDLDLDDEEQLEEEAEELADLDEDETEDAEADDAYADVADEAEIDAFDQEVHDWALRVVELTDHGMPRKSTLDKWDPTRIEKEKHKQARKLVQRAIPPGSTYLVRWSGTRKGTGTFYTKPGLAVPTVRRTLEPLAFDIDEGAGTKTPKTPDEILDLKVCDPAMGSGSFPVAATRYLTDALRESFRVHVEDAEADEPLTQLGEKAQGLYHERIVKLQREARNQDNGQDVEARIEAQLKRAVVENCIYGVDINPLAVELAKLSLWVETMDPELPFGFLDHKLRCGNSLIGAWLDEYAHYPTSAWERDWATKERKKIGRGFRNNELKTQMETWIQRLGHDTSFFGTAPDPVDLTDYARNVFERLHEAPDEETRAEIFREEFLHDPDLQTLRHLMDRWCAVWFWPADEDTPLLDPDRFYGSVRDEETSPIVKELARDKQLRFFHWELEFPDVFGHERWGFDAVLGNPPWDKKKPEEDMFFPRYKPEFTAYNKSEKRSLKKELFEAREGAEKEWNDYQQFFKNLSNFVSYTSRPRDVPLARGKKSTKLDKRWAEIRDRKAVGVTPGGRPFRHQGSADLNTYKMFAEGFHFLARERGRTGFIVPAGLYSDYGTQELRELFLSKSSWEWLYSFENRNYIFDIAPLNKFAVNIIEKGKPTGIIKARFMAATLDDWMREHPQDVLEMTREQVELFSPQTGSFIELTDQKDLGLLTKIYKNAKLVGDAGVEYLREYDQTNDADYFTRRDAVPGLREDGTIRSAQEAEKLSWFPVYTGTMIYQFDFSAKLHNQGRSWESCPHDAKRIRPKYYMPADTYEETSSWSGGPKLAFKDITNATYPRTFVAALIPDFPATNKAPILRVPGDLREKLVVCAALNSYVFDYATRYRLASLTLNWFIVEELPLPENLSSDQKDEIVDLVLRLNWHTDFFETGKGSPQGQFGEITYALSEEERARIRERLDELVAEGYGLEAEEMAWILRPENEDERSLWRDYRARLQELGGKGKWGRLEGDRRSDGCRPESRV